MRPLTVLFASFHTRVMEIRRKGKRWSGIVVGSVGWGALPQIVMGFLFFYWVIGVSDAHEELLVMLLSLAIHCYISHIVLLSL